MQIIFSNRWCGGRGSTCLLRMLGWCFFWSRNGGISRIASREAQDNSSNGRVRGEGVESDDADLESLYTNHSRSHEQNSAALVSSLVLHVPCSWIEHE